MKFALIGFGQTGHLIKQMAEDRGHEIAAVFNRQHSLQSMFEHDGNPDCDRNQILASIDAFIDFSIPTAVATNVECVSQLKKPIVIGTSGWYERLPQIEQLVNSVQETHHRHKVDSPSGTALRLGEIILENSSKDQIITGAIQGRIPEKNLHITSLRTGAVPGIHTVGFESDIDSITLTHTARDRTGYAVGAVMAAEWIVHRTGFYTMSNFLDDFMTKGES